MLQSESKPESSIHASVKTADTNLRLLPIIITLAMPGRCFLRADLKNTEKEKRKKEPSISQ